eukprot:GHVN01051810.1.p1 GENE.GHVN01051810.1~~GHVN01051810.1.p1  ORF type:complete len:133 (+),score=7.81 GHVN01051810.1:79-477(+)
MSDGVAERFFLSLNPHMSNRADHSRIQRLFKDSYPSRDCPPRLRDELCALAAARTRNSNAIVDVDSETPSGHARAAVAKQTFLAAGASLCVYEAGFQTAFQLSKMLVRMSTTQEFNGRPIECRVVFVGLQCL